MATFITEFEATDNVKEAFMVLKSWNEDWYPAHFITDCSEVEVSSVQQSFEGKYDIIFNCFYGVIHRNYVCQPL